MAAAAPSNAQVVISLAFKYPANGNLPSTQSFVPAGLPQLPPNVGAIVFRRGAPPPSQACRFTVVSSNPAVAEVDPLQSFLEPLGTGGTGDTWQALFLVKGKAPGAVKVTVTWVRADCGIGPIQASQSADVAEYSFTVTEAPNPDASGPNPQQGRTGDPVSTFSGSLVDAPDSVEFDLGGPLPLRFVRHYSSTLGAVLPGAGGGQGLNWMHNFDVRAAVAGSSGYVTLFRGKQIEFARQPNGSWALARPEAAPYQFASAAGELRFADPAEGLVYTFTSDGRLREIRDGNGNALTVTRAGGSSGPDEVSDGLGRSLEFTYAGGRLGRVEDRTGRAVTFAYTGDDLTSFTNAAGRTVTYAYGPAGLQTSATLPAGNRPFAQTYDGQRRVLTQTDSRGNVLRLAYGADGETAATDPTGAVVRDRHDARGNLTRRLDGEGAETRHEHDAAGRRTATVDRRGARTAFEYDPASGMLASETDALGAITRYTYAAQVRNGFTFHNLTSVAYPDSTRETYEYDARGNRTRTTDRAGRAWTRTYDARGNLLSETNPAGGVTAYAYNANGTLASVTQPSGEQTALVYDAQLRPARVNLPGGVSRQFTYDAMNRVLSATDERGNVRRFAYNDNGRLQSAADALNRAVTLAYDGDERVATVTDPLNRAARAAYDGAGRPSTLTDPTNVATSFAYDRAGRVASVTNNGGKIAELAYDREGDLVSVTDALGRRTQFERDALGRATRGIDALGRATNWSYDSMGRLTAATNPAGETVAIDYEARGLPSAIRLPENVRAGFGYGVLGLPTTVTDANGGVWTLTYDASGRLASEADPVGRTARYDYDNRQRVGRIAFPQGSVNLAYDPAGNLTRAQYSDGTDLQYAYDANNRLTAANELVLAYDANGRVSSSNGIGIERDAAGRVTRLVYAPGKAVVYTYNNQGLIESIRDWVGGATTFVYDAARQVTSTTRPNGVVTNLTYAADGRLAKAVWSGGSVDASIEWQRDAAGRVVGESRKLPLDVDFEAETVTAAYDAAHQRSGAEHDALGRVVSSDSRTYRWDLASRLTGFTDASQNTAFRYDGLGQLTGAGSTYVWLYGLGLPRIAVERQGQADIRYYIHSPSGQLLHSIEAISGERRFYHVDERGTVLFLTGGNGAVTDSYAVTPYGEVTRQTGQATNTFVFLGAYGAMRMGDSGLYYLRARFYDARHGRFLSKDPLRQADPLQINPYQYAAGNPVGNVDPTGLTAVEAGAIRAAASPNPERPSAPFVDVTRNYIDRYGAAGSISWGNLRPPGQPIITDLELRALGGLVDLNLFFGSQMTVRDVDGAQAGASLSAPPAASVLGLVVDPRVVVS